VAMQTALSPSWLLAGNSGADVVDFLRGVRSKEGTQFRSRGPRPPFSGATPEHIAVLGDIVNAEPVVVGPPKEKFTDAGYAAFRTANASRPRMVYQGANDGMLHAFTAANGAEAWAYMPGALFRMPQTMASPLPSWPYVSALTNLGLRVGFAHKFYVDSTPTVSDIDSGCAGLPCTGGSLPVWRTMLVGGLGKGGFGYYALDITSPTQPDENALKTNVVKWEFPNATTLAAVRANIGYGFGKPVFAKTAAAGWVVLVSSGYNNGTDIGGSGGDGKGYLFVLNAATGALIRAISTGTGSPTDPSGLGPISAWQNNAEYDATAQFVYGGDLKGNLWRFDLTQASDPSQWSVAKLANLTDTLGNPQPVSSAPELALIGTDRFVYVGSGRYLGMSDVPGSSSASSAAAIRQSIYGLKDDLSPVTIQRSGGALAVLASSRSGTGSTSAVSISGPSLAGSRGWVLDLPGAGERIVGDPQSLIGALTFTSNVPIGADPCDPQGASYFWQIDYRTGRQLSQASYTSKWVGAAVSSRPIGVQVAAGYRSFVNPTDGGTQVFNVNPPLSSAPGKRKSWRELGWN
jgi:type IV pilus assembly protein PilY1